MISQTCPITRKKWFGSWNFKRWYADSYSDAGTAYWSLQLRNLSSISRLKSLERHLLAVPSTLNSLLPKNSIRTRLALFTMVNGKVVSGMVRALLVGLTIQSMTGSGKWDTLKGGARSISVLAMSTKASGLWAKLMDSANIRISKAQFIRATGWTTSRTVKGLRLGQRAPCTKART